MHDYQKDFIKYALSCDVLRFGLFTLKSGRQSPYFFNTGLFNSGASIARLGRFYAAAIRQHEIEADVLYGPAYKGIPLAVSTAIALADHHQQDVPFVFNRKEMKDHGEGGHLVGAELTGRVLILDDVISAGTSVRESIKIIEQAGARPAGVLISLDRQEKGQNEASAIKETEEKYGLPVYSIISLSDILAYLQEQQDFAREISAINKYLEQYGLS